MAVSVDFNSGSITTTQPLAVPQPSTWPDYQASADATSDVGGQILNNQTVEQSDRGFEIKAVLIVGGTIALAIVLFGTKALFPDSPLYPYAFVATLLFSGAVLCAPISPYEHQSRMAWQ